MDKSTERINKMIIIRNKDLHSEKVVSILLTSWCYSVIILLASNIIFKNIRITR